MQNRQIGIQFPTVVYDIQSLFITKTENPVSSAATSPASGEWSISPIAPEIPGNSYAGLLISVCKVVVTGAHVVIPAWSKT